MRIHKIMTGRVAAMCALGAVLAAGSTGCNNAVEGGLTGGALGALGGLAIGSLTGNAGAGAATGAILGGIGGAVIGDQNHRHSRPINYGPGYYPQYHHGGGYNSYPY
ncbi:MAG: hypothetical protein KF866_05605 [Phycisphaeraceae bacterium]|nr:hypothetical protein [Phycisphaeraceae bacterium]MCW5754469.1 hypothetical protein [Phycisphaeraceae bacterium]